MAGYRSLKPAITCSSKEMMVMHSGGTDEAASTSLNRGKISGPLLISRNTRLLLGTSASTSANVNIRCPTPSEHFHEPISSARSCSSVASFTTSGDPATRTQTISPSAVS